MVEIHDQAGGAKGGAQAAQRGLVRACPVHRPLWRWGSHVPPRFLAPPTPLSAWCVVPSCMRQTPNPARRRWPCRTGALEPRDWTATLIIGPSSSEANSTALIQYNEVPPSLAVRSPASSRPEDENAIPAPCMCLQREKLRGRRPAQMTLGALPSTAPAPGADVSVITARLTSCGAPTTTTAEGSGPW